MRVMDAYGQAILCHQGLISRRKVTCVARIIHRRAEPVCAMASENTAQPPEGICSPLFDASLQRTKLNVHFVICIYDLDPRVGNFVFAEQVANRCF